MNYVDALELKSALRFGNPITFCVQARSLDSPYGEPGLDGRQHDGRRHSVGDLSFRKMLLLRQRRRWAAQTLSRSDSLPRVFSTTCQHSPRFAGPRSLAGFTR